MSKFFPRANKDLGQHFLHDQKVISIITSAFSKEAGSILEVGAGPAVLTPHLKAHGKPMGAIEMDRRFEEKLVSVLPLERLMFADALDAELDPFLAQIGAVGPVWLVSNLPYNVSVPLFLKFLRNPQLMYLTLMFQREVGDRITREMGSLMSLGQTYFQVTVACKVSPGAFVPPPQVDSVVLNFVRRPSPVVPLEEFKAFETFLRRLFQMKRKQIHKVLRSFYPLEKIDLALSQCQINRTDRAEALPLAKIQELYKSLL